MKIRYVVVTDDISKKIERKHGVSSVEVDEMFFNPKDLTFIRKTRTRSSVKRTAGRYVAFGRTFAGRYLTAVFIWIKKDTIKVITVRDMEAKEKQYYRRQKK